MSLSIPPFSNVFKGYRNKPVVWNGATTTNVFKGYRKKPVVWNGATTLFACRFKTFFLWNYKFAFILLFICLFLDDMNPLF